VTLLLLDLTFMSHSSGIPVSKGLADTFGEALTSPSTRFIKVKIENDELVAKGTFPVANGWEDDLEKAVQQLEPNEPSYILFQTDEKNTQVVGNGWLLLCYVPDKAKVREKMTYASSRANLRRQLGTTYFIDEVFGTVPGDFNKAGYQAHRTMQKSESPLTWSETQSNQEKEHGVFYGGTSTAYVHGVSFPVENGVIDALKGLVSGSHNYVSIHIDADNEKIVKGSVKTLSVGQVGAEVPNAEPAFHFYSYHHDFEGQSLKSIIYIYSCPDGSGSTKSAPVRLRMLYSSSKANIESILNQLGAKADLKLEVNQGSEVTEESILVQLHPPKEEEKKAFAKPKGPSKGGKRLIK